MWQGKKERGNHWERFHTLATLHHIFRGMSMPERHAHTHDNVHVWKKVLVCLVTF